MWYWGIHGTEFVREISVLPSSEYVARISQDSTTKMDEDFPFYSSFSVLSNLIVLIFSP